MMRLDEPNILEMFSVMYDYHIYMYRQKRESGLQTCATARNQDLRSTGSDYKIKFQDPRSTGSHDKITSPRSKIP